MENVFVLDHPLLQHKISLLRDKNTGPKEFRELVEEIALLEGYEATRDLPLKQVQVETPLGVADTNVIAGSKLAVIPILRAGLGMVDGILKLVPAAKVGHLGLYRDPETKEPVEYYAKLPVDVDRREVLVLDPMLATGNTACAVVDNLKRRGVKKIKMMYIIATQEGLENLHNQHPDVKVYCGAVDKTLNEDAYIVPGLGDAGDRIFGTK